jgi:hypothetical protein
LQRAQLLAALSVGTEIIRLRDLALRLGLATELDTALESVARGNSAVAAARFAGLDDCLGSYRGDRPESAIALRARASILAISEALDEHAAYFDAEARE